MFFSHLSFCEKNKGFFCFQEDIPPVFGLHFSGPVKFLDEDYFLIRFQVQNGKLSLYNYSSPWKKSFY